MQYTEWEIYKALTQENLLAEYYPGQHKRSKIPVVLFHAFPSYSFTCCLPLSFCRSFSDKNKYGL